MNLKNIENFNKEKLIKISTWFGILAVILSGTVLLYQFLEYLYNIQWFYYWKIDIVFYQKNQNDSINSFLNSILVLFFLIYFSIVFYKVSTQENKKIRRNIYFVVVYIFYFIFYFILNLNDLYQYNFAISRIILHLIVSIIVIKLLRIYFKILVKIYFVFFKKQKSIKTTYDILILFLICMVSLFFSATLLGNFNVWFQKKYSVSCNESFNTCDVILYSNKDYYIVSNGKIENNNLIIYKDTTRKIDNYDVSFQTRVFNKIVKQ